MKSYLIIAIVMFSLQTQAQSYQKIHDNAIVVDTHNDILTKVVMYGFDIGKDLTGKTHSDLFRWKKGGLDVQFFSVWSDGNQKDPFAYALRQMDSLDALVKRNRDKIVEVANSKELYKAVKQHKLATMFGIEGGHQIEDDLGKLDSLYKRGARYMTLTWNNSTSWASSAYEETASLRLPPKEGEKNKSVQVKFGLNDFGKQVIHRMNELGMMVDVSHVGETTFWDVINTTTKPIIASHSSVYALCHHQRNLKDDQIKAIAKNGGVIQINFNSGFLDSTEGRKEDIFREKYKAESDSLTKAGKNEYEVEDYIFWNHKAEAEFLRPPFSLLMQHIEYVIKLVGVDYVGIESDYDGVESVPQQMDDVTKYPLITKALVEKGYSEKDIDKILGGNLLRVLKANENK